MQKNNTKNTTKKCGICKNPNHNRRTCKKNFYPKKKNQTLKNIPLPQKPVEVGESLSSNPNGRHRQSFLTDFLDEKLVNVEEKPSQEGNVKVEYNIETLYVLWKLAPSTQYTKKKTPYRQVADFYLKYENEPGLEVSTETWGKFFEKIKPDIRTKVFQEIAEHAKTKNGSTKEGSLFAEKVLQIFAHRYDLTMKKAVATSAVITPAVAKEYLETGNEELAELICGNRFAPTEVIMGGWKALAAKNEQIASILALGTKRLNEEDIEEIYFHENQKEDGLLFQGTLYSRCRFLELLGESEASQEILLKTLHSHMQEYQSTKNDEVLERVMHLLKGGKLKSRDVALNVLYGLDIYDKIKENAYPPVGFDATQVSDFIAIADLTSADLEKLYNTLPKSRRSRNMIIEGILENPNTPMWICEKIEEQEVGFGTKSLHEMGFRLVGGSEKD